MKPEDIEIESFRIILKEMGAHHFTSQELPIVQRVIHATADFEYQNLIRFSPNSITKAIAVIRRGCQVISDVRMIEAGVNRPLLNHFHSSMTCLIDDKEVAALAKKNGKTRSETAMQVLGDKLNDAIVLIGNAPTALHEVLRLYADEGIRPAMIVGVPVGFVNAAESKEALSKTDLDYITVLGRKGGSTVAVSIFNALMRLAKQET